MTPNECVFQNSKSLFEVNSNLYEDLQAQVSKSVIFPGLMRIHDKKRLVTLMDSR